MLVEATNAEGGQKLFLTEDIQALNASLKAQGIKMPIRYREITGTRQEQLDVVMERIYQPHRYRWCSGGLCACLGCANGPGRVVELGFSHAEWKEWVERHPNPEDNPGKKTTSMGSIVTDRRSTNLEHVSIIDSGI